MDDSPPRTPCYDVPLIVQEHPVDGVPIPDGEQRIAAFRTGDIDFQAFLAQQDHFLTLGTDVEQALCGIRDVFGTEDDDVTEWLQRPNAQEFYKQHKAQRAKELDERRKKKGVEFVKAKKKG